MGFLLEEGSHHVLDTRDARRSSDEDDFVDVAGRDPRVLERALARTERPLEDRLDELLEACAVELELQVLGPAGIRGDEGQIDLGLSGAREFDLGFLGGILEPLQRKAILAQVDAILFAEFVG